MKILLINPPDCTDAMLGVGRHLVPKYEPLGLLYIAAVLIRSGHKVTIIDAFAEELGLEELKKRIALNAPEAIGVSTLTCNGASVFELGRWIKSSMPGILLVLGNVHASVYAKQYLENKCCDVVVHGEGERAFLDIVEARKDGRSVNDVAGISFLDKDLAYVRTPDSGAPQNLEELPFPARELLDPGLYNLYELSNQFHVGGRRSVTRTMSTSRGCHYRCSFCVVHNDGRQRWNTPERVVDEMELLAKKYGVSYITMVDPLFISNQGRVFQICAEIKKRGLKVGWGCEAHVHCVTPELLKEMESAGCRDLAFGIESGVQRLLDAVNKTTTIEQIRKAVALVKGCSGISVSGLFILGLPGETYADSLETVRFAKSLPLDMAQFSILTPYPGSSLFDELSKAGQLDTGIRPDGGVDVSVWERYSSYVSFTGNDPIWVTPGLTAAQIRRLQKKAQRDFYCRPGQIIKHLRRVRPHNLGAVIKIITRGFF